MRLVSKDKDATPPNETVGTTILEIYSIANGKNKSEVCFALFSDRMTYSDESRTMFYLVHDKHSDM